MSKNTPNTVDVVRCCECIHWARDLSSRPLSPEEQAENEAEAACLKIYDDGHSISEAWQLRKASDFCSYGKRRADTRQPDTDGD